MSNTYGKPEVLLGAIKLLFRGKAPRFKDEDLASRQARARNFGLDIPFDVYSDTPRQPLLTTLKLLTLSSSCWSQQVAFCARFPSLKDA